MDSEEPPDPIREILREEQSGERARRPFIKALTLWTMALNEDARDYPLSDVVTPESLNNWDLDEIAEERAYFDVTAAAMQLGLVG